MKTFIRKSNTEIGIGCRDFATLNYLRSNNIPSYFSSCLTTTLTKKCLNMDNGEVEREGIILTDAPEKARVKIFPVTRILNEIRKYPFDKKIYEVVLEILKHYDGEKIEFVRHEYKKQEIPTHEQRFEIARNILRKYARARLVITSRIHCALPCLALGTPVVLVTKKYDNLRYGGLSELLNHVWLNDLGKVQANFKINSGDIKNSDEFVKYAEKLRKICSDFINE